MHRLWLTLTMALTLSCVKVALSFDPNFFLGEKHEYGHVPIDRTQPQYSLFYWLFRSRSQDPNPPLVIWVEGGPGCSSQQALFMEHGPFRMEERSTKFHSNPYSWNNAADVIFLDQPLGTGLSNCSNISRIPTTAYEAARDFYGFLMNFFAIHKEYAPDKTKIYFAGHSYAGHFIPAFIVHLYEHHFPFTIAAAILGNPYTNPHLLAWSYPEFAYQNDLVSYFTYVGGLVAWRLYEFLDSVGWRESAYMFFRLARYVVVGLLSPRFNSMDIRGVTMRVQWFEQLMRSRIVKELNMEDRHWQNCNPIVSQDRMTLDHIIDYTPLIEQLLEHKLPIFFYYGAADFICNTLYGEQLNDKLNWTGATPYREQPQHFWFTNGKVKGLYQHYANMWYVKVFEAGHLVFFNDPEFGYDLLTRVLQLTR